MARRHAHEVSVKVSIAKFLNLTDTTVVQTINVDWDQWLTHLTDEPAEEFSGTFKHAGWSPATFSPPQRALANVRTVQALVLDYDKDGSWDIVLGVWAKSYGVVYTTKSHGASATNGVRLRAVLPLERAVTVEEYAKLWAWAQRISADAGCPLDAQCRDASRFWYDPTKPPGGWQAQRLTGATLDPDGILPRLAVEQPRLAVVRDRPTPGSEERAKRAAAYLAKIPGAVSGDAGHNATFNAVAAVLIGFDLDEQTARSLILSDYNTRCDPPWSEREIDHKIKSVGSRSTRTRGYLLVDRPRISTPQQAAQAAPQLAKTPNVDWMSMLNTKKDGTARRMYMNTAIFVRHHPNYAGKWSIDTMTNTPWFDGGPTFTSMPTPGPVREAMIHEIRAHIESMLTYTAGREDVEAAIAAAASERPFHSIQQYLRSIDWDGTPRLSSMARDYLGSSDPLHAEMVRKWMIGAAKRAIEPGCKLDTTLMLVGAQGIGKSTFFAVLGGSWHADSFVDITNKDSFVQIHSAWLYELAELENVVTGRAESRLKAWLTSTHDTFRAPYQRTAARHARACVICGTTNRGQFITDDTGSRRFWIVPVAVTIDRNLLTEMRDQIWAEAVSAADSGEQWWLSPEADAMREKQNDEHREHDEWHDRIAEYLARPDRKEVTIGELLEHVIGIEIAYQDRASQLRAQKALALMGWDRVREGAAPRRWKYVRPVIQAGLL